MTSHGPSHPVQKSRLRLAVLNSVTVTSLLLVLVLAPGVEVTTAALDALVDLQIQKADGGISVAPGETIQYTLVFTNTGSADASGVLLTDTVPVNTVFDQAASTTGWTCDDEAPAGTVCVFDVGAVFDPVPPGSSGQLSFAVKVDRPLAEGANAIFNAAAIGDDGAGGPDANPADNFDAEVTPLLFPDLQIQKADGGISVAPGETIQYTLVFTNTGSADASGVLLTDTVPVNTVFDQAASTTGWTCDDEAPAGTVCVFDVGAVFDPVPPGSSGQLSFAVKVDRPLAEGANAIFNAAAIGDDGSGGPDPNPADNFSVAITPVELRPDLGIRKSAAGDSVGVGQSITYTLNVTNTGQAMATGVRITDTLPAATEFIPAASTQGWECSAAAGVGNTCVIDIGSLEEGGATAAVIVARVETTDDGGTITNTAEVGDDGSAGPDPNPDNNVSSTITRVDSLPEITIAKTADPSSVDEPGGNVEFGIELTNESALEDLHIDSLRDSEVDLGSFCPGTEGSTLTAGTTVTCTYPVEVSGNVGDNRTNIVTVEASDDDGNSVQESSDATVTINDVVPQISVTKEGNKRYIMVPGEEIVFTVEVRNDSVQTDPVQISSVVDDLYGDVSDLANPVLSSTTCEVPQIVQPGYTYQCQFTVFVESEIPSEIINTVEVTVQDDEGTETSDEDSFRIVALPPSAVTDSSLCLFDWDPALASHQFRLIFTPDLQAVRTYKLSASNPGQFFYNAFFVGEGPVSFDIEVPFPFVTQGAITVHGFTEVSVLEVNGYQCFVPDVGSEILSLSETILLEDYTPQEFGNSVEVSFADVEFPDGLLYVNIHLDYGLKKTSGYGKDKSDSAVNSEGEVLIPNLFDHVFSVSGDATDSRSVSNVNVFKRIRGFSGLVTDVGGSPLAGKEVKIFSPDGVELGTVLTDADGWYIFVYKHRGKAAFYSVQLPEYGLSKSVELKANSFVEVNFEVEVP